jgi:hypothetical protein
MLPVAIRKYSKIVVSSLSINCTNNRVWSRIKLVLRAQFDKRCPSEDARTSAFWHLTPFSQMTICFFSTVSLAMSRSWTEIWFAKQNLCSITESCSIWNHLEPTGQTWPTDAFWQFCFNILHSAACDPKNFSRFSREQVVTNLKPQASPALFAGGLLKRNGIRRAGGRDRET